MKKKTKITILWIAIIAVALIDAVHNSIGVIPIIGDFLAIVGNWIWEIIEIGLIFGLFKVTKKG